MELLETLPVTMGLGEIKNRLRTGDWELLEKLLEEAGSLISGKAVYEVSYIEEKVAEGVLLDGIRFQSKVLRKNLENAGRVFPYVVTIGRALEKRSGEHEDLLAKYYLDTIGTIALVKARKQLENHLRLRFALEKIAFMSPGSLEDWPLEEQKPLFSLLGDVEGAIGVRLNEGLMMVPKKSVSGIYFPTETTFYSCQLCPREHCEGRKASYDQKLAEEYGISKT